MDFEALSDTDENVQSPCVRNCCLDYDDICLGCFRSLDEILRWNEADNQARMAILENASVRRKARRLFKGQA